MQIENTYYSIFMNAVEGIFQSTPDGQYLNVNPSLAKMYGYDSPSELMRSVNNIASQLYVNPDRRQEFIDEMTTQGIVKDFVSQIYRKDKTKIWITENVRIVRDDNGKALYYEGFVSDITPLIKSQERNNTLQSRLQQAEKMETIGTMANGIAHDFGNILSPILGYSDLLLEMIPPEDKICGFIEKISTSAKRGKELIHKIHAFGQPNADKNEPIQIESISNEVLMMIKGITLDKIDIQQDIPSDLPEVQGDTTQIHQILLNLCKNAVQAMEDSGGTLTVKLRERKLDETEIDRKLLSITPGCYIEISIKDTGSGMPENVLKKIFDPYFTTKNKGKGTGLGLATVQSIVKNYKGEIIVKSKPGKGTTFTIFLPTIHQPAIIEQKDAYQEPDSKHVMLVDDDQDVLQVQGFLLEQLGYAVSMFKDGNSALQSFQQDPGKYDVVLTDYHMPNMTGLELSKSLLDINRDLPIIICTGFKGSIDEPKTKAFGVRELIYKPLTSKVLTTHLSPLLYAQSTVGHS